MATLRVGESTNSRTPQTRRIESKYVLASGRGAGARQDTSAMRRSGWPRARSAQNRAPLIGALQSMGSPVRGLLTFLPLTRELCAPIHLACPGGEYYSSAG